jgi:hypothetical protein
MTPLWVLLGTLLIVGFAAGAVGRSHASPTGLVAAYVDVNGNGVEDTCETGDIVADPDAAAAEDAATDLDGDGTISVSEAARSDRIGGLDCDHGSYVSSVAQAAETATDAAPTETAADQAADTPCVEGPPPDHHRGLDKQKNAHGRWVSHVAQSDAIGGKDCNHGGAVSEAAKKDHRAAKAARDAAKATREAAREAKKAARDTGKAAGSHGKGNPHQD